LEAYHPASLLGRFVLNSWEGALLRMRAEKSDAPLIEFKEIIFRKLLVD
jgi:TetR/AcrR family transcriptional repressor of nem operon